MVNIYIGANPEKKEAINRMDTPNSVMDLIRDGESAREIYSQYCSNDPTTERP